MYDGEKSNRPSISEPPSFCEYAGEACDQTFGTSSNSDGFFIYPSDPELISSTIEESIPKFRSVVKNKTWLSWKDLGISGQIIFCKICKALRFTNLVIADVTTLNFNLLFEIGYAIGLGRPVLPIRDTTYIRDARIFEELGILDTVGYIDFQNSATLLEGVTKRMEDIPIFNQYPPINSEQPLYLDFGHLIHEKRRVSLCMMRTSKFVHHTV